MAGKRTRERGELEREVMRILWESGEPLGAAEIQAVFTGQVPAYTTLMTALDRLEKKHQVLRLEESPRKVKFQAARSEEEHASLAMTTVLDAVANREAALLRFAGNLDSDDLDLLRQAIGDPAQRRRR